MPSVLQRVLDQFSELWGQLTPNQRILVGSLCIAIVVGLILAVFWVRQPNYVTLYSGLDARDAAAIAKVLKENDIAFKIVNDGTEIQVPHIKRDGAWLRDEAWILVSNANLPRGETGLVGFEIFDKRELGMTDAEFQQKYQRALQGHLSRLIEDFPGVRSARVTIVPQQKSLFREEEEAAKASIYILLEPEGEKRFGNAQIFAVANLVSHSVPGLKKENISIAVNGQDVSELIESKDLQLASVDLSLKQLEAQKQIERYYTNKIQMALNRAFGYNTAEVIVRANLDFTQMEKETETFSPPIEGATEGLVRSEHEKRESYSGIPGGLPGGVPGVDTNVPGPPQYPKVQGGVQPSEYESREVTRNYEMNHSVERWVGPVRGTHIRKLSAAILMDEALQIKSPNVNLKQEIENLVRTVLASANTLDAPEVHVSFVPFKQPEPLVAAVPPWWERPAELALIAVIVLAIVLLLRSLLVPREYAPSQGRYPEVIPEVEQKIEQKIEQKMEQMEQKMTELLTHLAPPSEPEEAPSEEASVEAAAGEEGEPEQPQPPAESQPEEGKPAMSPEEEQRQLEEKLEKITQYIREHPEEAARLLSRWINEG